MAKKTKKAAKKAARKPAKRAAAKRSGPAVVKPIPDHYPPLMPFTLLPRCAEAIEFYKQIFGAKERLRMPAPDGTIAHAELAFGPSVLMLADASAQMPASKSQLCLYVKDIDATHRAAVEAGCTSKQEPATQFYGDRSCRLVDPFGTEWAVMTHVEDVSEAEMTRRAAELYSQGSAPAA